MAVLEIDRLMYILRKRKDTFARVKPTLTSIVPIGDIQRFLRFGSWELDDVTSSTSKHFRAQARREMLHLAALLDASPSGVQIGLTSSPLTTGGFSRLRLPNRSISVTSPFRLSAPINVKFGVATLSEQEEALQGHDSLANHIWETALKGSIAADRIIALIKEYEA